MWNFDDLVQRARRGDFKGVPFGGLVRMSTAQGVDLEEEAAELAQAQENVKKYRPTNGQEIKNLEVQEGDIRKIVEWGGGIYVHTYEEPATSAWKRKKVVMPDGEIAWRVKRPVYEGALQDLRRGYAPNGLEMHGLFCYDIDRLTRDNRHLEDAIDTVTKYGRPILDFSGTLDLLTDNGRTVARIVVATKAQQSADTSRRVSRKHEAMQQAGIKTNGRRAFGWNEDRETLNETETRALRAARKWLRAGVSTRQCIIRWTKAGIRSTSGKEFTPHTFKYVMRNPRLAGYRMKVVHTINPENGQTNTKSVIVYDENGEPVMGQWERVFTPEEFQEVLDILGDGPKPGDGHNARKYLGSGTLRCGKCAAKMKGQKASPSHGNPPGFYYYVCPPKHTDGPGCGGVKIDGPGTDAALIAQAITYFEDENEQRQVKAEQAPQEWGAVAELARVEEELEALHSQKAAMRPALFYSELARLDAAKNELTTEKKTFERRTMLNRGKPVNLRRDWGKLEFVEQRGYIELAFIAVTVKSVGRGRRNVPITDRLDPVKREW